MLLAGPATNLLLAFACCCWLVPGGQRLVTMQEALVDLVTMPWVSNVGMVHGIATATSHPPLLVHFGWLNLSLAALNLLPFWPLDGGRILCRFLPASQRERAQLGGAAMVVGGALFLVLRDCYRLLSKAG
jgi:Zn-dependent protease